MKGMRLEADVPAWGVNGDSSAPGIRPTPIRLLCFVLLCAVFAAARAQSPPARLTLHEVFGDHAVLQREAPLNVWGNSAAGETVTVSLGNSSAHVQADASGHWSATLPAMSAGGPFTLTARSNSGEVQSAADILLGDVFLCSGQSNMEMPVLRAGDSFSEINNSAGNTLRMLSVAHASSPTPLTNFHAPVAWQVAAPATVPDWSAVCFFFARELQKTTHVPIGLVHSSWGGSNIRPWMSVQALQAQGGYAPALGILQLYRRDEAAAQSQFARQWEQWWRDQTGDRIGAEPWSLRHPSSRVAEARGWRVAPDGLGDWRNWGVAELKDFTGLVWYRTRITLNAAQAAAATVLALGPINQIDETWINGRAVGNTFGYGSERNYPLPPGLLHAGDNVLVVNVLSTYGGGGLLAGGTRRSLKLAGGESIPLDGPWQYRIAPAPVGYPPRTPWEPIGGLSTLYNAMIAPIGAYGLRGVLWYQGESNTGEAQTYQSLLAGLMADWRHQFGAQLPFLIVQLPNYGQQPVAPAESGWAAVREAERQAVLSDPHAGLAVTIDVGEAHNLHPTNKQDVGKRLARAARHVIYGESIAPSGPAPRDVTRVDGQVAVEFADVERGLVAYSHDSPIGFELCGDSPGTCRYAAARIDGARVILSVPAGMSATRVRYCWGDSPVCTLFDQSGLPAGPFEARIHAATNND
jgi:sialate O-acetylesterase